ncbi:hypothetical protein P7K49_021074, partial [Saguinus oedipus]
LSPWQSSQLPPLLPEFSSHTGKVETQKTGEPQAGSLGLQGRREVRELELEMPERLNVHV